MQSLSARLFAALTAAIFASGLVAGSLAFHWAFDEAIELQDAVLLQVGALAVRTNGVQDLPPQSGVDPEAKVTIVEIGREGRRLVEAKRLPLLPADLPDGLQTMTRGGEAWRVLVRSAADGRRIAVGQPTASRDEIAREGAIRTIAPLAVLFPILMLLTAIIIRTSLRSVANLALELDATDAADLDTLPLTGMPDELVPFIASINRLLARIGLMLDRQRRFVAAAAHELRTPITALSLQAENIGHSGFAGDSRERLEVLNKGMRRLAHLLEQLLAASKYDGRRPATLPTTRLDKVVKVVVADHLKPAQDRSIDLGVERLDAISVRADATSLAVLLRNLIDNALRHTPDGGRIDINLSKENSIACLTIEDTGPGIASAELDRVFEPFFRGEHPNGEGSGLGLSIVRNILESARGSISIENIISADRSGLRVTITLPLDDA